MVVGGLIVVVVVMNGMTVFLSVGCIGAPSVVVRGLIGAPKVVVLSVGLTGESSLFSVGLIGNPRVVVRGRIGAPRVVVFSVGSGCLVGQGPLKAEMKLSRGRLLGPPTSLHTNLTR